jgi:hypothetical protein
MDAHDHSHSTPSDEQAMGSSTKMDETHNTSKTTFGLPTAPMTPQPEDVPESGTQQTQYTKSCLSMVKRAKPQSVKRIIGKKFTPTSELTDTNQICQSITFMKQFEPFSLEELRLADHKKLTWC